MKYLTKKLISENTIGEIVKNLIQILCFVPLSQNVTANHRVNDVVFTEDGAQTVTGRFMYGPLDMVTLTGEKVTTC